VALATAATLLATGLVAAPAAQAGPVVDTSEHDGTVITTRMNAKGTTIYGDVDTDEISRVRVRYWVDLEWTGGELQAFEGVVTLQRAGARQVRTYPVTLDTNGDRSKWIELPGTVTPGSYRMGIEFTAAVERPDGRVIEHTVDVNNGRTIPVRRQTMIQAVISNPTETDGRPSRISGRVRALSVADDGDVYWSTLTNGTVSLSYDPDGPWEDGESDVFVRNLTSGSQGWFQTGVLARDRWWYVTFAGSTQWAPDKLWLPQGDHSGCGC
jgi:hypothetical protein